MKALLASHYLTEEHLAAFKKLSGSERVARALLVTCAAVPYGSPQPSWVEESFAPLRSLAKRVDETTFEEGSFIPEDLLSYDFIFVSGSNSFYLAWRLA